jgi:rhomboid protease GluP
MNKYKNYPITYSLIIICIIVYIITTLLFGTTMSSYDALQFLGYNPLVVSVYHQYYRLITANFIHFGIFHLVVNCYSLYNIGTFIERILPKKDYIIVLISSMISTNLISYILYFINGFGENTVCGGISGVICGLLGALAALSYVLKGVYRDVFKSVMPSIILMIIMSITLSSISLSGHLSGMFGGFVSMYIILKIKTKKRNLIN